MFYIFPIYVDMQDVGHSGVSRRRVYTIVALKEAVDIIKNPIEMYSEVVDFLNTLMESWGGGTVPSDYLTADATEIQLDAMETSRIFDYYLVHFGSFSQVPMANNNYLLILFMGQRYYYVMWTQSIYQNKSKLVKLIAELTFIICF